MLLRGVLIIQLLIIWPALADNISPQRQDELRYLLRQDCGSCHGMTLKGGLGPALTLAALQDKPPQLLLNTVLDGRPGTAMPPWRSLLTDAEAAWLVAELLRGTPE